MAVKMHINRGSEIKFNYTVSEVTTYPSLPDPASVVPKPEVQHAVPGRNSWSKAGRQAGWTWSGSQKRHMHMHRVGPIRLLVWQRPRLRLKAELSTSRNISMVGIVLCFWIKINIICIKWSRDWPSKTTGFVSLSRAMSWSLVTLL